MKIGIDLDNTIISYDKSFALAGKKLNLIPEDWFGSKLEVREFLRKSPDGEDKWQRLQGKVYGRYLDLAELYPGVYRFLWRCKKKGIPVDIVSHKTEYGHYDDEKVSLRKAALDFLSANGLNTADEKSFIRNVSFHNTKEEKVGYIKNQNYSYFIDDLKEILIHPDLETIERKLFFDPNQAYQDFSLKNTDVVTSWGEIEDSILGKYTQEDLEYFRTEFGFPELKTAYWSEGQGNSRIAYLETSDSKKFALKLYPADSNHNRLSSEFFGFKLLHQNSVKNVPLPIHCSPQLNCAVYEWVNGEKIHSSSDEVLDAMLGMMKNLNGLAKTELFDGMARASASCFSGQDIENQIQHRLKLLYPATEAHKDLKEFLDKDLVPFKDFLIGWVKDHWGDETRYDLPIAKQFLTLSPSDFGFHNMLKSQNGEIVFLDFEYFGWDDPVKLIVDVSFHPAMNLEEDAISYWKQGMFSIFGRSLEKRYETTWAMYSLCWCLILLNEFRKDIWMRRVLANSDKQNSKTEILKKQLNKSIHLFQIIRQSFYKQIGKG
ncbi:phosphotransferase [Leptospira ilyithenensis]|uniref:Phosphotransferase n=1 Tax=Leptospira ilyithenensis TaxID=2484901 RepID=A0A4R9LP82_9LEPT|nr:phosphotransferase [Leptospira ilyithenensis]TGN07981.1 phosphotransferase [Leptospira ilyithenensis]